MAYVDRFIFRFNSLSGKAVRISIADNDYTGTAVERRLGGSPQLRCELSGNIHGMSLEIPAECEVDDEFAVLYTSDPTRFAVRLEVDSVVVWRGFVTPELYAAPWIDPPYDVQITATDGLGELKMLEWPAIGSRTLGEILETTLGATGLALPVRMISTAANDLATAADLLTGTTVNLDHMAGKSYYDVLDGLLGSLHCTILQRGGAWLLVRETDVTSLTSGGQVSDTSGNTYPVKPFGSSQTHDCWPVGRLTTEIIPAKSTVEVECPNHLESLISDPDMELNLWQTNGSWTGEDGGYYTLDLGEYISQTASVANATGDADPGFRIKVSSRNTTPFDVGIMRLTVMATGRDPRSGSDKTLYLKEVTTQGRTQMEWVAEESHFDDGLGMPKTLDHQDCKEFVTDIFRLPTGFNPIKTITIRVSSGRNTMCVHSVNIECMSVYDKAVTRLLMDNGARGDESNSPLFADSFVGNKGNYLLSNSLRGVAGAMVRTWSSDAIPSVPYGEWLSKDMALSVATPRLRMSGRLFTVTALPDLFYSNKGLSYITEEWSLDLIEDESDIFLISLPAAALSTVSVSVIVEDNDGRQGAVSGGEIVNPKTGETVSSSGSLDWFIAESYEEDGETKYRLKLNPKYQGMYAEGWVSAGGLSDQGGGGGGSSYLKDLLDVSLPAVSQIGLWQGLLWDGEQWVNGDVERPSNRVTSVSSASTDTQYPTAKAVYDIVNTMLSSAMRFQGVTSTALVDGSTTNPVVVDGASYTATKGDVVVRSDVGLEFLWTGAKWQQLGDETSYAKKTVTITGSGYLTGGGNLEAARTIDIADAVKTKIDNGATAYGYFTDGAANEAIKLRTPRTIWGQSFDGTANISGYMTGMTGLLIGESTTPTLGTMEGATALGIKSAAERYGLWEWVTGNGTAHLQSGRGQGSAVSFPLCLQELGGNVGIGTDSPAYKLDVNGVGAFKGSVYANYYNGHNNQAGGAIVINKGGDYFGVGPAPSNISDLAFGLTSDAEGTWKSVFGGIANNGNVGIGTSVPGALFHVHGPSGEVVRISQVSNYTAGSGPELSFYNSVSEKLASVRGVFDRASGQYGNLLLGTRTSDAVGVTTKMTILYNGNVGIGTTPAYKLDVDGDVRASGKVYIGSTGAYFEVDSNGYLHTNFPLYSDSWVSSGGVSGTGGSGAVGYLHDLLDVDDDLNPSTGQALVWDGTEWVAGGDISGYEKTDNKVTSISSSSTDTQYPSAKAVHTALADYLPLAGGVMTGVEKMVAGATPRTSGSYLSFIHYSGSSEVRDADVSAKDDGFLGLYARNGIALRPGTGSAFDTAKGLSVTASDITFNDTSLINTYAKKTVTIKGSGYLSGGGNLEANRTIDIAESIKEKIDSGAAAYTSLGNYLPLNGGTMTGSITLTSGSSSIYLTGSDTAIVTGTSSAIGTTGNSIIGQAMGNTYLRGINDPVYLKYRSNGNYQEYTMWHAGNDGSGSGLDADLLDGLDSERFLRTFNDTSSDFSTFLSPGVVRFSYDHPGQPSGTYNYGNVLVVRGDGSDTLAQLAFSYSQNGLIAVRSGTTTNIGDKPWRTLACKDDNVASATKLQTARNIWGQSFDGSKDVNGKFLFNNGNATLKIFSAAGMYPNYGDETVVFQSAMDRQDPETSTYPAQIPERCVISLQPRGGRVGVGTTSPAYKLDVAGTVNINPSETAVPAIRIVASGNSANHGINYVDASGNIKARFGVNSSTGLFQIFANGDVTMRSGGTSTSGFTISSPATSGNVTSYMMYPAIAGAITLNSDGAFSALGNGADLASPGTPMRSVSTKVIYLASGIYIYYDTVHNCIRTNAPIISDSYISAGGVSTT